MQRAKLNAARMWACVWLLAAPAVVLLEWPEDPHALTAIATPSATTQFDRGHLLMQR
jgi:hypothetical protein